jgi:large subunit ribosomal protein L4
MEATIHNADGSSAGSIELPPSLFADELRPDLLHRVVESARHNQRNTVAHTKDRRDRRGGGTKPWQQKGTGRARHGSIRSPLWRKGGVTFGPRKSKNLKKKVNQKEKRAALRSALSAKHDDEELLLVDSLGIEEPNASRVRDLLDNLGEIDGFRELADRNTNAALFVLSDIPEAVELSMRNFGNIDIVKAGDLHALDLLTYKFTVFVDPQTVIGDLKERLEA